MQLVQALKFAIFYRRYCHAYVQTGMSLFLVTLKNFFDCTVTMGIVIACPLLRKPLNLRLRSSVCSLIIHELQLSSVPSTTLIFISTHTEQ